MNIIVVLDNIRSALNVGAILRTADGAGIDKLLLGGFTPSADHPKVKKTALGAEDYVKWEHFKDLVPEIRKLKEQGYKIIAVEQTDRAQNQFELNNKPEKAAIIFGNEIAGVSPELLELADLHIELPMQGKKNSLNVATTVGITIYNYIFNGKN